MPETGWRMFDRSSSTRGPEPGAARVRLYERQPKGKRATPTRMMILTAAAMKMFAAENYGETPAKVRIHHSPDYRYIGLSAAFADDPTAYTLSAVGKERTTTGTFTFNYFYNQVRPVMDTEYEARVEDGMLVIGPIALESDFEADGKEDRG